MVGHGVSSNVSAIGVQPKERESPGPRRREILDDREGGLEKRRSPSAAGCIAVLACAFGECPKGPAVAIFRTRSFQPSAVVAHEISKPAGVWIPGMLDERRKARGESVGQLGFARF